MCDHCDAFEKVLTDLMGRNVAGVIMRRARKELHGMSQLKVGEDKLTPAIHSECAESSNQPLHKAD